MRGSVRSFREQGIGDTQYFKLGRREHRIFYENSLGNKGTNLWEIIFQEQIDLFPKLAYKELTKKELGSKGTWTPPPFGLGGSRVRNLK